MFDGFLRPPLILKVIECCPHKHYVFSPDFLRLIAAISILIKAISRLS
jgi:hypothetical protein